MCHLPDVREIFSSFHRLWALPALESCSLPRSPVFPAGLFFSKQLQSTLLSF
jgi:hypothetical protein